jgi:hypothetical protein
MTPCPNCSWPHHSPVPITLECVKCGATVHINGGNGKQDRPKKTPEEIAAKKAKQAERQKHLPRVIRFLESRKQTGDTGAGDTVERLLASVGGRKFKRLMKWLGAPCGCEDRQKWLNEKWPWG